MAGRVGEGWRWLPRETGKNGFSFFRLYLSQTLADVLALMDADERQIYHYLKARRREFVSLREISRDAAGKRRGRYSADWAQPALTRMTERGILDCDGQDGYRLRPMPGQDTARHYASPKIAEILKASGKDFDHLLRLKDEDEYYDKL